MNLTDISSVVSKTSPILPNYTSVVTRTSPILPNFTSVVSRTSPILPNFTSAYWNLTNRNLANLPLDSNFPWLLCALCLAMFWIVYITYYNSRVIGFLLTKVINNFIKCGYFKIGSFSVSVLSGKVMFRDVVFINEDYSIRIQDGWLRFRYWKRYVKRSVTEDLSHSDTRLSLLLNGFELHIYNRSAVYARLERLLGLDPSLFSPDFNEDEYDKDENNKESQHKSDSNLTQPIENEKSQWRDLIPVIKVDISGGRLVFGNRLLPTTLLISVEEAHLVYTTKPAYNKADQFMHTVKCRAENFKVILAPSPKYTGMDDEPPRFMGEGFVVLQSNKVELYHYRDEPGIVPDETETMEFTDDSLENDNTAPVWGLEIKCGKGTDFSYGPWADRQREHLFKFFFPQDFQPLKVTKIAQPGERRQFRSFDIRLSTLADATVDMLFSKEKETMAVHMNIKPGSYLEMTIPLIISESGYTTIVNGQLFHLDATSSLQYRTLVESETLEFDARVKYPLIWNDLQQWTVSVTGCKATANLIYEHKSFFQDLFVDWGSKSKPDLLHFVPYVFHFNLILKEYEIILICNENNWIDCSSHHQENSYLAVCGELFDLSIELPFTDFLPPTLPVKIWIHGECVDLAMYLPETNTCRNIVTALAHNGKLTKRDGSLSQKVEKEKKWRNKAKKSDGWVDCWTVPIVALSITYIHHPVPLIVSTETDFNITTPEKEEILLNPIRPPTGDGETCLPKKLIRPKSFDPTSLPPDVVIVELEVGTSVLFLYGSLLRNFKHIKENYFGADQKFSDFDVSPKSSPKAKQNAVFENFPSESEFDQRLYRPLEVTVSITMHDIQAHLMKNCKDDGPPCPSIYLERFGFEMHKTYLETKLQVLLSPVVLSATDVVQRIDSQQHLKDGHLALSGLQVRGHAMFSDEGLDVDEETIEYSWLIEIQLGHFTGRLTAPHLHHITTSLETFMLLVMDPENALQLVSPYKLCHHGVQQLYCADTKPDLFCPTADDIKYRMTRLSVESINLFLVESSTCLNAELRTIKLATCNLHGHQTESGVTALIQSLQLRQYVMNSPSTANPVPGSGQGSSAAKTSFAAPADVWLEVGTVMLGPVYLDSIRAQSHFNIHLLQDTFLHKHDERTKRLWFLWPPDQCPIPQSLLGKCGCRGACNFFGSNRNLINFFHLENDSARPSHSKSCSADPSYGQSLLHKGQMIFDVLVPNRPASLHVSPTFENSFSFTRGYMNQGTPIASRDISQQSLASILLSNSTGIGVTVHSNSAISTTDGSVETMPDTIARASASSRLLPTVSSSAPVVIPMTMSSPLVQRAYSQPETELTDIEREYIAASAIPFSSSSIASFSGERGPSLDLINARVGTSSAVHKKEPWHNGRAVSITSLQAGNAKGAAVESPTKDGSISRHFRHNSRNGHHVRHSSMHNVQRTTSMGGESVLSLDVFYNAEDELGLELGPEPGPIELHSNSDGIVPDVNMLGGSNQSLLQTVIETLPTNTADNDTNSASSTSFISAVSSQEDLALVDLHMQLNKPITESPLLMFAYNSHMTRLMCSHWYEPPPLPHNTPQSMEVPKHQACWGSQWIPHFFPLSEGFTSIKVVDKEKHETIPGLTPPSKLGSMKPPNIWDFPQKVEEELPCSDDLEEEIFSCDNGVSKTTLVIKLEGDVDICISPLMLETSQHFIEAVTPTVSALHPLTIINHLHSYCVSTVQAANQLKKEKYMYVNHLKDMRRSTDSNGQPHQGSPLLYEETHTSQLQAFISVAKINVSVLQASISEEMTSFSALDNIRDITCVSLLIMSLSSLSGKIFTSKQSRKSIQTVPMVNTVTMQRRKGKESRLKKSKTDWYPPEPLSVETSETQQEELIATFEFQKVHTQLRRLKNSSSILKEAALTVIPKRRSKVFFAFEKHCHPQVQYLSNATGDGQTDAFRIYDSATELDEIMGFIMFECGLESFDIKAMKRVGFDNGSATASDKEVDALDSFNQAPRASPNYSKPFSTNSPPEEPQKYDQQASSSAQHQDVENDSTQDAQNHELLKDVFSGVVNLKTVWFNFAAPPHMPNTQRIDYTRLDWHLLSTATPAINSWLNPSNRLVVAVQKLIRGKAFRQVAVIACLMAEALDAQELHLPVQAKCNKFTPLAKTLREDPSCQLLTVLQRYMNVSSLPTLEDTLGSEFTPKLEVIHKGLVALARQWKNVLYMPSLVERNIKMQTNPRPFSVSFAVPLFENIHPKAEHTDDTMGDGEITDESIRLLNAEGGSISTDESVEKQNPTSSDDAASLSSGLGSQQKLTEHELSSENSRPPKKRLRCHQPRSSRATVGIPVRMTDGSLESYGQGSRPDTPLHSPSHPPARKKVCIDERIKKNMSTLSLQSESVSVCSHDGNGLWNMSRHCFPPEGSARNDSENLYNWMAKQQDYLKGTAKMGDSVYQPLLDKDTSRGDTLGSDDTKTSESQIDIPQSSAFSLAPLAAQLADAHVIFNPLLTCLKVPSQIVGSSLGQRFGPNLTVRAALDLLRIDIVESETTIKGLKTRRGPQTRFYINTNLEAPAFQCEKLSVEVDLREVQDLERAKNETSTSAPAGQQTLIYAVGGFQKHSTVAVNFCINVHYVCQQVNLPLLRLLHQFSSMYQNACETQMELKERHPRFKNELFRAHKKNDSSSGSESHTDRGKIIPSSLTGSPVAGEQSPASSIMTKGIGSTAVGTILHRPQSLTQRLRASARGYTNLMDRKGSPLSINLSEGGTAEMLADASCTSDHTLLDQIKERTPRCWRTMYYLLDLYATMPETKTITNRSPVVPSDISDGYKGNGKYEPLKEHRIDMEETGPIRSRTFSNERIRNFRKSLVVKERVPLVIFGVVKVRCTRLLATLSGLKLEAELSNLQASHTHKEKVQGSSKKWTETSATGYLGHAMIVLLEGVLPNQQTVVKVTVGKTQALYSGHSKHSKEKNSALITVGPINADIPQHPVALHGMMTRSTKQLSTTLQELRVQRVPLRHPRPTDDVEVGSTRSPRPSLDMTMSEKHDPIESQHQKLLQPIVVHFSIILDSLTIGASLLPSLSAQYQMGQVTSIGVTGSKAKFTVDLPKHSLSFVTKIQMSEANLPSSASVALPPLHLSAEYVQQSSHPQAETIDLHFVDGAVLRKGNYLNAVANLGAFEHSLTTDLLNHLVFVQKVFMKEINEVVQKMSGGDKPVRLWTDGGKGSNTNPAQLLYSVQLRLKGIQITAMTPTNSAVRLETGLLELQLSNRVQNLSGSAGKNSNSAAKLFGKAHVELHVSLGQLVKDAMFEEADPEFQQVAYFTTRVALRNALQDEMVSNAANEKEAVLITLHRPLIYIQPVALDKAVLVWLNYKNAYEYWNEQRSSLNKEVLTATQQVLEKVPPISQFGSHGLSALFLQLTVDDLGICLPLSPYSPMVALNRQYDSELRAACVVTLESTRISACSSGSLVSKGRFQGLCIRFADDFETSLDDWKPDNTDPNIMNLCVVSEGTYEVCSRTIFHQGPGNAKWILNVQWEMEGVAIHVDTNIGKHLSALAHTLTSLASSQDLEEGGEDCPDGIGHDVPTKTPVCRKGSIFVEGLPAFVFDPNVDSKKRSRLIEHEMNEQVKIVNDLRVLGASHSTIEQETRRLADLENLIFSDFKRDVIKKLRRQSMKQASSFKEKLGLSSKHAKPTSLSTPAPTPDKLVVDNIGGQNELSPSSSSPTSSSSHGHARTTSLDSARVTFQNDTSVRHYGMDMNLGEKWPSADTMDLSPLYGTMPPLAFNLSSPARHPSTVSTPTTTTSDSSPHTTTTPSDLNSDLEPRSSHSPNENMDEAVQVESNQDSHQHGAFSASNIPSKQSVAEPNIDFELDVKVNINSGKCVLHTKDFREEELRYQKGMGRERSFSSSTFEFPMSPGHRKKGTTLRPNAPMTKMKLAPTNQTQTAAEFTLFLIPGLEVKVHYNSRTECLDVPSNSTGIPKYVPQEEPPVQEQGIGQQGSSKRTGMKRASLFAWMTLQSIPEETVITPHILDFLEKALEPIPLPLPQTKGHAAHDAVETDFDNTTLTSSLVAPSTYAYASFPVDVIVYLRIQPSTLRFSCLPISRVECLLRLPSLDLVISTKRAEEELSGEFGDNAFSSKPRVSGMAEAYLTQAAVGGLSVTACLADFSVYIFHPYGGKKAGSSGSNKDLTGEASPLAGSNNRKDALSIQLEFVKVNISRSRKITLGMDQSFGSQSKQGRSIDQYGGAVIRFSTICDIGSASFKYDMRRLTEILAFPKAWYRRSIVRRLFLGEQSTTIFGSDQEDSGSSADSSLSPESVSGKGERFSFSNLSLSDVYAGGTEPLLSEHDAHNTPASRGMSSRQKFTLELPTFKKRRSGIASAPPSPLYDSLQQSSILKDVPDASEGRKVPSSLPTPLYSTKAGGTWETLVLFAVNLSKLNIHMNMGNVMGNTVWTTRGLQSQGRLSIGSSGHKNMAITVGLGGSSLDAKGGIVGGTIELSQVDTSLHIKEDPGQEPDHRIGVKLFALESRLDYMGTSVVMGRVSSLDVTLRDEWRVHSYQSPIEKDLPTKRPALIFIHGDLAWDQLQLMLSKSTTPDLMKMHSKLEEFFTQQFHSSKRVFSSFQPSALQEPSIHDIKRANLLSRKASTNKSGGKNTSRSSGSTKKSSGQGSPGDHQEPRHHRHWQSILAKASSLKLPTLVTPLPKYGTILGGTMELHGNNISLSCFHGINFRAKSWALFSLREPTISFATEAQDIINADTGCVDTHIIQNLSFTLGHNVTEHTRHINMATVCRMSRNTAFPPQFRSMQEWFHYAFAASELDEVDRFPGLERERRDSFNQERQARHSPKGQDCNHTMEMIFALPSLQLHLKTEHLQTQKMPGPKGNQEVGTPAGHGNKIEKSSDKMTSQDTERKWKMPDPTESLQKDWRDYECKTWHLEPTVRLMSWAGKRIEPYGVDYILQKLGFSHARVTIPKWMQRGAMDPLDKLLSVLMEKMVNALREGGKGKNNGAGMLPA